MYLQQPCVSWRARANGRAIRALQGTTLLDEHEGLGRGVKFRHFLTLPDSKPHSDQNDSL